MNIFVTDNDPIIAAQNLCNEHVKSKMQIEGAIMLAHAFSQEILNHPSTPRTKTGQPRKSGKGYYNHTCSVWARKTKDNFMWLVDHTLEMFKERKYRWPTGDEHFTLPFIKWCKDNIHNTNIVNTGLTPFAVAINKDSICRQSQNFDKLPIIEQYREFIRKDKPFASWDVRPRPKWY